MSEETLKRLGEFIEKRMFDREAELKRKGALKQTRVISRSQLAKMVGVSKAWMSDVINGKKVASDELLLKTASVLDIDQHVIFKMAGRIHPNVLEKYRKEYLGDFYFGNMEVQKK